MLCNLISQAKVLEIACHAVQNVQEPPLFKIDKNSTNRGWEIVFKTKKIIEYHTPLTQQLNKRKIYNYL